MRLPALCDNCGAIFPSGFEVGNSEAIYFEGNREQCPVCGEFAHIPDGLFNFTNNVVEIVQAPDRTEEDLKVRGQSCVTSDSVVRVRRR